VITYKDLFKKLVITGHHDNFALPFFHMKNEPFYRLMPKIGMIDNLKKQKSINSLNKLNEIVAFAELDKNLFLLMQEESIRAVLIEYLLQEYFESTVQFNPKDYNLLEMDIEHDILNESQEVYQEKLKSLESALNKDSFEEEIFIRGGVFKKTVPKIYGYSCCVSEFAIKSNYNIQMVDACHIVPFSINQNDTIQNGISLSPNIHRAFDRGLLTINDDYLIRISPSINRDESSTDLFLLDGKRIQLPKEEKHMPSLESLDWHRREVFLF